MEKWLKVVLVSVGVGLVVTLATGLRTESGPITINVSPDYCMGPTVVGYRCPDITAKGEGLSRGYPASYLFKAETLYKQDGVFKSKSLKNEPPQFKIKEFLLDVAAWSLVAGVVIIISRVLRTKTRG